MLSHFFMYIYNASIIIYVKFTKALIFMEKCAIIFFVFSQYANVQVKLSLLKELKGCLNGISNCNPIGAPCLIVR